MATNYEQKKYEESQAVKNAQASLEAIAGQKPGAYQSQYQPKIQNLTDQILNRGQFQYDLNGDALYNQYKDRYVGLGQQAMMDTMGQAAKLTGGYGNSYAQMAGQQAYHGYLQGLNDKVPELYQLALQRYNNEGQDLYNRYGLLSSQEEQDYNRFMNNYNMWNAERDWLAGRYDTERGFDYGGYRDTVADDQWKAGFDEDIRRFDFANKLGEFAVATTPKKNSGPKDGDDKWGDGLDEVNYKPSTGYSEWETVTNMLNGYASDGDARGVEAVMNQYAGRMNEKQFNEAMAIINRNSK